jgi:uncharacterized protein (DUF697 family)
MHVAGIGVRDVLGVVRETREVAATPTPLVITGLLSNELARALRGGADHGSSIHVGGSVEGVAAVIVVVGGTPRDEDERVLRLASRESVPVVVVQTDPGHTEPLAYVPASAVVICEPGKTFPVEEIATTLAAQMGHDAVSLAEQVPAFREPIARELVRQASRRAAIAGALPWRKGADLPVLTLIQARLVLDLAAAHGHTLDRERAVELAAVAGTGLTARALVRRLPRRLPLVGALTGYLATRALGEAAIARFSSHN